MPPPSPLLPQLGAPPCVLYEDDDLLVVNKPAGLNTHAPSPYAGEGLYDWLRHREPRWASLAIIHRLDKETSGVIVFAKTPRANRSLTAQFTRREVRKKYLLVTDRPVRPGEFTIRNALARKGERYVSRPAARAGAPAETRFRVVPSQEGLGGQPWARRPSRAGAPAGGSRHELSLVAAEPLTGRTHQVRAHAAQAGFPILGDLLYEGTPAPRVFLHAAELVCHHPATGEEVVFRAPAHFERGGEARVSLRGVLIRAEETNAWRLVHGAADGWPGWYVDRLGDRLLSEAEQDLSPAQRAELARLGELIPARGLWHKVVTRHAGRLVQAAASPQPLVGEPARQPFVVRENGLQFELSFSEGYAVGLFLDQRDNRRRLLTGHVGAGFEICRSCGPTNSCRAYHKNLSAAPHARAERRVRQVGAATKLCCTYDKDRYGSASAVSPPGGAPFAVGGAGSSGSPPARLEVLNVFAYTCAFSVCAAKAGARTTSLDLSKKYLDWGKRNFALNQLDAAGHEFIYGDAWDWLRRLARRGRRFDVVLLDPPTFSRSRDSGVFRAERDYGRLAGAALPLLRPGGVLFASTNAAGWPPEEFLQVMSGAVKAAGRSLVQSHYAPQPPDFPVARAEPAYLKTVWLRVG